VLWIESNLWCKRNLCCELTMPARGWRSWSMHSTSSYRLFFLENLLVPIGSPGTKRTPLLPVRSPEIKGGPFVSHH
jgi:hypothetical protein